MSEQQITAASRKDVEDFNKSLELKVKLAKKIDSLKKTDSDKTYLKPVIDYLPVLKAISDEISATRELKKKALDQLHTVKIDLPATVYAQPSLPVDDHFATQAQQYKPDSSKFSMDGPASRLSIETRLN